MAGRKCGRAGCRAWAMRGERYCYAHRKDAGTALERVEATPVEVASESAFSAGVKAGDRERLVDRRVLELIAEAGSNRAVDTEVGALRLLLLRALDQESLTGDLTATTQTVVRLTDAIGRALKVRHALEGGRGSQLEESLMQVLREMDLGGDEEYEDEDLYDEVGFAEGVGSREADEGVATRLPS